MSAPFDLPPFRPLFILSQCSSYKWIKECVGGWALSQLDDDNDDLNVGSMWLQFKRGDGVMVIRLHIRVVESDFKKSNKSRIPKSF